MRQPPLEMSNRDEFEFLVIPGNDHSRSLSHFKTTQAATIRLKFRGFLLHNLLNSAHDSLHFFDVHLIGVAQWKERWKAALHIWLFCQMACIAIGLSQIVCTVVGRFDCKKKGWGRYGCFELWCAITGGVDCAFATDAIISWLANKAHGWTALHYRSCIDPTCLSHTLDPTPEVPFPKLSAAIWLSKKDMN